MVIWCLLLLKMERKTVVRSAKDMPRRIQVVLLVLAAVLIGISTYAMLSKPLWGWYPIVFLSGIWCLAMGLLGNIWTRHRSNLQFLILSSLSGVFLSAGFPPSPLTPLIFIGFVPLLIVEDQLFMSREGASRWEVFKYAYNAFFIWNACTTWWLLNTSFIPGIVAIVLNSLFMAIVFTLFHQAKSVFPHELKAIALIAFWITFEWIHHLWEVSWPWLTLGNALSQYPQIIQWYDLTGPFGGTAWILLLNWMVFLIVKKWLSRKDKRGFMILNFGLILLIPLGYSLYQYYTYPLEEGPGVEVAVVQPNYEPHYQKFHIPVEQQLDEILSISDTLLTDDTKYLVFPETSIELIHLNAIEYDRHILEIKQFLSEHPSVELITGITSYRTFKEKPENVDALRTLINSRGDTTFLDVQNAAIQIGHDDEEIKVYFKSKLVPGAEFFPYRYYIPFLKPIVDMLQGSVEGLSRQPERTVFKSEHAFVAPVICYESVYGSYVGEYVRRGADMIFIVTNDGWWDWTPGHLQHLKIGAMLAIEYRRPIARSANTGISCFVNARGDILQATHYNETTGIRRELHPSNVQTVYYTWGDLIARVSAFLSVMLLALTITRSIVKHE